MPHWFSKEKKKDMKNDQAVSTSAYFSAGIELSSIDLLRQGLEGEGVRHPACRKQCSSTPTSEEQKAQTCRIKIWKVLGSATEWVSRGSIGWAGAVSGGQGQYQVGRGSIGWAGAVSAVPLPKSNFQHIKKVI